MIDLSIIVVSFNTKELLRECLHAVVQTVQSTFELIVVDNASIDGSQHMVKEEFPTVTLVEQKKNLGFSAGNNTGIRRAKGKYILLLNSDAITQSGTIDAIKTFLDERPDSGIVGCQTIGKDGMIQPSAGFIPDPLRAIFWMLFLDRLPLASQLFPAYHKRNASFFQKERRVDWVQGAFLCFRHEMINRVGLLDEKIFLYAEDVDWCWRAVKKGYHIIFTPVGQVRHLGQGSSEFSPTPAIRGELEIMSYLYKKHYGYAAFFFLRTLLIIGSLLRIIIFGIIQRRKDMAKIYVGYLTRIPLS